jgi:ATP-dependent DNA ligase
LLLIDGEAVALGVDGISDFEALCSRKHDAEVQLYAFYVLALDGEDLRRLPLSMRKTNLDRLSARRPEGIFVAPFEQGGIGPDLFRAACKMGLEGLSRSGEIAPIVAADARTGSRSRTRRRWR